MARHGDTLNAYKSAAKREAREHAIANRQYTDAIFLLPSTGAGCLTYLVENALLQNKPVVVAFEDDSERYGKMVAKCKTLLRRAGYSPQEIERKFIPVAGDMLKLFNETAKANKLIASFVFFDGCQNALDSNLRLVRKLDPTLFTANAIFSVTVQVSGNGHGHVQPYIHPFAPICRKWGIDYLGKTLGANPSIAGSQAAFAAAMPFPVSVHFAWQYNNAEKGEKASEMLVFQLRRNLSAKRPTTDYFERYIGSDICASSPAEQLAEKAGITLKPGQLAAVTKALSKGTIPYPLRKYWNRCRRLANKLTGGLYPATATQSNPAYRMWNQYFPPTATGGQKRSWTCSILGGEHPGRESGVPRGKKWADIIKHVATLA